MTDNRKIRDVEFFEVTEEFLHPDLEDCNPGNPERYFYPCRACGEDTEIEEPPQFDPDYVYCGGSSRCIP